MKISFSKAASTLSLAALAMTAATSAQAAITNLDLNIKRVILVKDTTAFDDIADTNADGNEYVAFEAATSADNQVVNLLSTDARNGITLSLNPVTAAQAGVYRNVIIELDNNGGDNQIGFSSLSDQGGATPQDISSTLTGLTTVGGTSQFILLGSKNVGPQAAFDTAFGPGLASIASMKPVELSEGTATLPSLDIQIPATAVVDAGAGVPATFTQAVVAQSFVPTSIANVNSTLIKDTEITVPAAEMKAALDLTIGEDANATRSIKMGLFDPAKGIAGKAAFTDTQTFTTDASADLTADVVFTFTDVEDSALLPILFGDDNNNDKIDVGEEFVAADDNTAFGDIAAIADYSAAADPIVGTVDLDDAGTPPVMVTPTVTVSMPIDSDNAAYLPNGTFEITLGAASALNGDSAPTTGTVTVTIAGTSYDLAVSYEDDGVTDTTTFANAETAAAVLTAGSVTAIESINSIAYTADTALEVTLPFINVTGLTANGPLGTVPVVGVSTSIVDPTTSLAATLTTDSVPNAITGTVANVDYTSVGEIAIVNSDTLFAED